MHGWLRRGIKNERGVALIEFVIVFPVLFLLLFGGIELTRYILIVQRLEKSAYVLTDIVGQLNPATATGGTGQISDATLATIFARYDVLMGNYANAADEAIIFTSVVHRDTPAPSANLIRWQRSGGGTMTTGVTSVVNGSGVPSSISHYANGTCPVASFNTTINNFLNGGGGGAPITPNENMIVGEFFYDYRPIAAALLGVSTFALPAHVIHRTVFLHPRNGDLLDPDPAFFSTTGEDCAT